MYDVRDNSEASALQNAFEYVYLQAKRAHTLFASHLQVTIHFGSYLVPDKAFQRYFCSHFPTALTALQSTEYGTIEMMEIAERAERKTELD